jgi:alkylation response protein AidB-like acyl-CoA dehydrogenase
MTLRQRGWPTTASFNSLQASMAKAKAGRAGVDITLRCVELCGSIGYGEGDLLEKWARDAKILDLFEGTQQIQLLIIRVSAWKVLRRAALTKHPQLTSLSGGRSALGPR